MFGYFIQQRCDGESPKIHYYEYIHDFLSSIHFFNHERISLFTSSTHVDKFSLFITHANQESTRNNYCLHEIVKQFNLIIGVIFQVFLK